MGVKGLNTPMQILNNIEYEVESLSKFKLIDLEDDSSIFVLGAVRDEKRTTVKGLVVGEHDQLAKSLAHSMHESEEVRSLMFDAVVTYIQKSEGNSFGGRNAAIIKLPMMKGLPSSILDLLANSSLLDMLKETMANNIDEGDLCDNPDCESCNEIRRRRKKKDGN